ncbi:putative membrane transporter [Tribonema minus]|uniref:Putative membrane transporter n=1 Tax=Tribonema minus TaxID=303371 RepID=A0A836CH56_9STRA|nr:putative membrane transporter [Tribonema minus]
MSITDSMLWCCPGGPVKLITLIDYHPEGKGKEPAPIRNLYITAMSYNAFTFTDGALRLVVLLHADELGFDAIQIAIMFSLYEVAGVFTNLFGGVAGSKFGLFCTLMTSIFLQIVCLGALMGVGSIFGDLEDSSNDARVQATVYITAFQCFSGVAKDFMKLTGKSTPKLVTKEGAEGRLFRMVAWITGMKNATKGLGSLIGAVLVGTIGYVWSLFFLICVIAIFAPLAMIFMDKDLGRQAVKKKVNWSSVFKKGHDVNTLSAARFWLFGSRDIWFEIALPLFLKNGFGWASTYVGLFMAGYIIIYGNLQAFSTNMYKTGADGVLGRPKASSVARWAFGCATIPAVTGTLLYITYEVVDTGSNVASTVVLVLGLTLFAAVFAVNSAIHSYLIVSYSDKDKVSMDLGFYYMSNALGRLVGVLLGGVVYQYTVDEFGLSVVLWIAAPFLMFAGVIGSFLKGARLGPKLPVPKGIQAEEEDLTEKELLGESKGNGDDVCQIELIDGSTSSAVHSFGNEPMNKGL